MLRPALAALLVAAAVAAGAAPAAQAQTPAPACPTFQVLHNDRIGALSLPAGPYTIIVLTPSTLSCAQAADLFRQFLQDFDGNLFGGWRVRPRRATFTRAHGRQAFSVAPNAAPPPGPAPFDGRCAGTFRVLDGDTVGRLPLPAGQYTITLLAAGRLSCARASRLLGRFLRDYDGVLPGRWFVDPETATFYRGSVNVGFRLEPVARRVPPARTTVVPADGRPCPGTFRVLHDDAIGPLRVPAGPYTLIPLRGSSVSCQEAADLFRRFLAAAQNALPGRWVVEPQTATFRRGRSSGVGFRISPAS